jgi:hypothetical protein
MNFFVGYRSTSFNVLRGPASFVDTFVTQDVRGSVAFRAGTFRC